MNIFYQSFLLRIWKTDGEDSPVWQASLEDPSTHTVKNFQDLDALFTFLRRITDLPELNNYKKEGNKNEKS